MKLKIHRRTFIINPRLQYFVSAVFGLVSVGNLVFFMFVHSKLEQKMSEEIKSLDPQSQQFLNEYIQGTMHSFYQTVIVFNIFAILVAFLLGALVLNHIAGPVYAIKKQLDDIVEGKELRAPLKLRKHDFFSEVAESVNRLAEKLSLYKNKSKE